MTQEELLAKIRNWDLKNNGLAPLAASHYTSIHNRLSHRATREWRIYLPADHSDCPPTYLDRLANWIGNAADESDQQRLLEYAEFIIFFSHDDFSALYRTALEGRVAQWVAERSGAKLEPTGGILFDAELKALLNTRTWFCPVTDSMDINEFYKVNHLQGVGHRPAFSTLQMLAEDGGHPNTQLIDAVVRYMSNPVNEPTKIQRPSLEWLVLLEDVVGSAVQCINAVTWSLTLGKPVLFVPLILCPNGSEALAKVVAAAKGRLTVRPVVELRRCDLLGPERKGDPTWSLAPDLEELIQRVAARLPPRIDPFGYRSTGCSVVTFANTPDNTIPLVHQKSVAGSWQPLFPRVFRD